MYSILIARTRLLLLPHGERLIRQRPRRHDCAVRVRRHQNSTPLPSRMRQPHPESDTLYVRATAAAAMALKSVDD
jgi:hypothetical protein